jgi:hypothetical protein
MTAKSMSVENRGSNLLRGHQHRKIGVRGRNDWKHGSIAYPKTVHSSDQACGIDDRHGIVVATHST